MTRKDRPKLALFVLAAGAILLGAAALQSVLIVGPGPGSRRPAHHQRRYQSPCSGPCTRFNSVALELAVARGGGCAVGAKRPIPDRRSARRTA